jgi:hypothetical protein
MDALCALRGEPAGTVVVSARKTPDGWWIASTQSGEAVMHPLDLVARGRETEDRAYDSAWAQALRHMEERAERAIARAKTCADELKRAESAAELARQMRDCARRFSDE